MGNLALHSAEEPDDLRSTTGTVEVPTIRDNDAALALGDRLIEQHNSRHVTERPQRSFKVIVNTSFDKPYA